MYCRKCGALNDDTAGQCGSCGERLQALPTQHIENNLVLAIVVTVLCCLPCGIAGIVYAAQVNPKAMTGDLAGARESAQRAKYWSFWGIGIGVVVYGVYALVAVMNALAQSQR
jgi:hypothetical protein